MPKMATFVVPPTHVANIYGVSAVEITARRVHLVDHDFKRIASATHCSRDRIGDKPFEDLVTFVRSH